MHEHRNVSKDKLVSLITFLGEVPDPRGVRTREHDLVELLVSALCTLLCRGESFYDSEEFARVRLKGLRTFLTLRGGVPNHDAFNRVFQALDPKAFADCLSRWTQSVRTVLGGEVVALDGKRVRRALKAGEDVRMIVSAWASARRGTRATRSPSCPNCCGAGTGRLHHHGRRPALSEEHRQGNPRG